MRPILLDFCIISGKSDACIIIVAPDSCGQWVSWKDIITQNKIFKTCHAGNGETNCLRVILRLQSIFTTGIGICVMNIWTSDHGQNIHNRRNPLNDFSRWRNYFRSIRHLNSYILQFSMYEYQTRMQKLWSENSGTKLYQTRFCQ